MRTGVFRFGIFQLKLDSNELRKHGVPLRLSGHALSILVILLEKPGEIVTRDEIQKRLWQADTFVDFNHGLNTAIKRLRAALGDSPENARYIETIPRVGYRFIAPLREEEESSVTQRVGISDSATIPISSEVGSPVSVVASTPQGPVATPDIRFDSSAIPATGPAAKSKGQWVRWSTALAAAVLLVFWLPKLLVLSSSLPAVLSVRPLTNSSRIEAYGRLQSDGARLFFLERKGHKWNLMQMPASGGEPQPFASPFENTKVLAISPDDGEMIVAPFARRDIVLPMYLMPSVGGVPRRLADVEASDAIFTPDGLAITFATADGIYSIQRDGLNKRKLTELSGRKTDLAWSPDGRRLRFTRGELDGDEISDRAEIWELDSKSGQAHALLPGWDQRPLQCCGKWTGDGRYFIFLSQNHGGTHNLWALDEQPGFLSLKQRRPMELNEGAVHFDQILPAHDGHRLFGLGYQGHSDYVAFRPETHEFRALLGGATAAWLGFSREQDWTISCRKDHGLWKSHADGTAALQLVAASLHPTLPRISADGKEVVFEGEGQGGQVTRVYVVAADGGQPQVLVSDALSLRRPEWAPDDAAISYSGACGKEVCLFVINRHTSEKKMIPGSQGFSNSRWSPDGKFLAATSDDNARIAVYEWSTQKWTAIAQGHVFSAPIWSRDSHSLFFQDILEEGEPVHQVTLEGHELRSFTPCGALLEGNVLRCGFEDVAPDGSLVLQLMRGDHDIFAMDLKLP
jgi:DNA-binding winged helix-turn-helix (wHTH) protein/Tol biopolymer transport system component